jgi:ribonuclease P protein component
MLPKSRRLTAEEVKIVLKKGRVVRSPSILARYTEAAAAKAAVVVSTKVAKRATERNRLRRKGYAALSANWRTLPARTHMVVFVLRKDFDPADIRTVCSKLS